MSKTIGLIKFPKKKKKVRNVTYLLCRGDSAMKGRSLSLSYFVSVFRAVSSLSNSLAIPFHFLPIFPKVIVFLGLCYGFVLYIYFFWFLIFFSPCWVSLKKNPIELEGICSVRVVNRIMNRMLWVLRTEKVGMRGFF